MDHVSFKTAVQHYRTSLMTRGLPVPRQAQLYELLSRAIAGVPWNTFQARLKQDQHSISNASLQSLLTHLADVEVATSRSLHRQMVSRAGLGEPSLYFTDPLTGVRMREHEGTMRHHALLIVESRLPVLDLHVSCDPANLVVNERMRIARATWWSAFTSDNTRNQAAEIVLAQLGGNASTSLLGQIVAAAHTLSRWRHRVLNFPGPSAALVYIADCLTAFGFLRHWRDMRLTRTSDLWVRPFVDPSSTPHAPTEVLTSLVGGDPHGQAQLQNLMTAREVDWRTDTPLQVITAFSECDGARQLFCAWYGVEVVVFRITATAYPNA